MPEVTIIPPIKKDHYNVGIYCRVSTTKEPQLQSMSNQLSYLIHTVNEHYNWTLVDVYLDFKSGSNIHNRHSFLRMIDDCKAGRIDLILVKSISRLGRNTVDALEAFHELRDRDVLIYFEMENIWSNDPNVDLTLTINSAFYEDEVRTRSKSISWSIRNKMQNGTSPLYTKPCYGYIQDERGELIIDTAKANVVRTIYNKYLEGYSIIGIIDYLYNLRIPSPTNLPQWSKRTIEKILKNEKYIGKVLLQKTFNQVDNRGRIVTIENNGQLDRYYAENSHPAIIDKEIYDKVQEEMKIRTNISFDEYGKKKRLNTKYSSKKTPLE